MTATDQNFTEFSKDLFIDTEYVPAFESVELVNIDSVFAFTAGDSLTKSSLARFRTRIRFDIPLIDKRFYLKRYDNPPANTQIKNWISHSSRKSTCDYDRLPSAILSTIGINTPKVIAYGSQWNGLFEKRSFIITEEIANAQSLEQKLPEYFYDTSIAGEHKKRCDFIDRLADLAKDFHATGLRHRDFYLAHIFLTDADEFYVIDLQRAFKPGLLTGRYRVKDIAQLHYSAPGKYISCADRLRFFKRYLGRNKLTRCDRLFIKQVKARAWKMAHHDIKHGKEVPFAS